MPLEPEALLNNRYRIVEILGQGGMGSVYRAIDENLGVEVAVKDNFFTTEEYARQFRREATILAGLRHPNLPRVTDHLVIEGQGQYLVMDYIAGEDLRQRMDRLGTIPETEAVKIGAAICDALSYLAACSPPIVHRDIKPGNVKIAPNGQIYLVDFGLAKVLFGTQLTTTGARAMTPGYSPPEQYGSARTDQRTDLYSLGATLYAALTGFIPEDALSRAIDQAHLVPLRKLNQHTPRRLANVIERSMEIKPDNRYQTAEDFKEALLNSLSDTRRDKSREFIIPPAPDSVENAAFKALVISEGGALPPIEHPAARSPASKPRPYRRQTRRAWLWLVILLLVALSSAGLLFEQNNPGTVQRVFAQIGLVMTPIGNLAGTQPVVAILPSPTLAPPTPTNTATPAWTAVIVAVQSPTATQVSSSTPAPTHTVTPIPTQLGGSSGRVAYASVRDKVPQIWVADLSTLEQRPVTNLLEGACQPDWSPDGHWLVFISPCYRNQEAYPGAGLFVINVDQPDAQPIPLSTEPGGDYDPRWSSDGRRILFTSERITRRPRLFIMDLPTKTTTLVAETFERDYQPSWSSNDEQIVHVSVNKGVNEIWTMNSNGSDRRQVTRSANVINSSPDWSPDGKVILFTQNDIALYIPMLKAVAYEEERPNEFQVSPVNIPMREARYSPDGLWLVFESWPQGGNHEIFIMTANGANRQQISNNPFNDFDAAWGTPAVP